jgi:hypothetical protein
MSDDTSPPLARRRLFAGAGAAGVVAAVAVAAPRLMPAHPTQVAEAAPKADPTGGYQATEHVLRYYQTARV